MGYWIACAAVFTAAYVLNIAYISVFYHRGLTHGAVRLTPWGRRFVVATGNWVTGIDPKGWAAMHRLHHVHSDTDKDPHSPRFFGIFGTMLAQLHSYNGVLRKLNRRDPEVTRIVSDLDFPVSWLNRKKLWLVPYLFHVVVWAVLGFGFHMWLLGYCYFVGIMTHPLQGWLVNSFGHSNGYRNYNTGDNSRNNTLVAWFVAGEGYQNNHHRFPKSAKFSVRWFEIDPGYAFCHVFQALGFLTIEKATNAREPVAVDAGAVAGSY